MFRLMWHVLNDNKSIWIALTAVYWVGQSRSKAILEKIKIEPMIKTKDLSYNFTDITSTISEIGEKFYLGINYTILFEEDSTLYMLVFKIKNIVVALFSSNISEDDVINYGRIIEGNIEDKVL